MSELNFGKGTFKRAFLKLFFCVRNSLKMVIDLRSCHFKPSKERSKFFPERYNQRKIKPGRTLEKNKQEVLRKIVPNAGVAHHKPCHVMAATRTGTFCVQQRSSEGRMRKSGESARVQGCKLARAGCTPQAKKTGRKNYLL